MRFAIYPRKFQFDYDCVINFISGRKTVNVHIEHVHINTEFNGQRLKISLFLQMFWFYGSHINTATEQVI